MKKHVFIFNPSAGQGNGYDDLANKLQGKENAEIYVTKSSKDGAEYVSAYCEQHPDDDITFYACGGDGTINFVANAVYGHKNAVLGLYPCGSGNDFVKYYGGKNMFTDIDELLNGVETEIDLMKMGDRFGVNIIGFGFDAAVCKTMIDIKRKKLIGGKRAYTTGVIKGIFTARFNKCRVWVDGQPMNPKTDKNGNVTNRPKMLLCTVANGQYVGGQFHCAPRSLDDDGIADVCLVHTTTLLGFIKLIGKYQEGTHLDDKSFQKISTYRQGHKIHVKAEKPDFAVSLDGEIVITNDFEIETVPKAIRLSLPKKCLEQKPGTFMTKKGVSS